MGELEHRVKNTLTVVAAVIERAHDNPNPSTNSWNRSEGAAYHAQRAAFDGKGTEI
jgi:two-component sensor histidine kinase